MTVKEIQEWLCFRHSVGNFCPGVAIDGLPGPATARALGAFQHGVGLPITGEPDAGTLAALRRPMDDAARAPEQPDTGLRWAIVRVAYAYLQEHPIEVGGQNRGPWVRAFMDGHEGDAWPWCAGFATFVVSQAARDCGVPSPVSRLFSCEALAEVARAHGTLRSMPTVGDVFLRRGALRHDHAGIVVAVHGGTVETIEGNTNGSGGREGFEVCARVRATASLDFVSVAP